MSWSSSLVLVLLVLSACTSGPPDEAADPIADRAAVESPLWLAGCWQLSAGELMVEEQWMVVRGGTMLGMSRTVRGGRLAGYELLLLYEEEAGWVYEAHPSGQPIASFRSSAITDTSMVFSNPDHDFPQTITYLRISSDSVLAGISGERGEQFRQVEFPYQRVPCPGGG